MRLGIYYCQAGVRHRVGSGMPEHADKIQEECSAPCNHEAETTQEPAGSAEQAGTESKKSMPAGKLRLHLSFIGIYASYLGVPVLPQYIFAPFCFVVHQSPHDALQIHDLS